MQAITEQAAKKGHVGDHAKIGIVTVSDRAVKGRMSMKGVQRCCHFLNKPLLAHVRCTTGAFQMNGTSSLQH